METVGTSLRVGLTCWSSLCFDPRIKIRRRKTKTRRRHAAAGDSKLVSVLDQNPAAALLRSSAWISSRLFNGRFTAAGVVNSLPPGQSFRWIGANGLPASVRLPLAIDRPSPLRRIASVPRRACPAIPSTSTLSPEPHPAIALACNPHVVGSHSWRF